MGQLYDWAFLEPGRRLVVHMRNEEGGRALFDATLSLERRELGAGTLARVLLRHPGMTLKVLAAIYWNALRLWAKRAPVFTHPAKAARAAAEEGRP
jgi:hypothetical protein